MPLDSFPITSPVIEALREGRARVERGWCQHVGSIGDRFCAMVALRRPCVAIVNAAAAYLCKAGGFQTNHEVVQWNDARWRTPADVLALYDKAIELAVEEALNAGH